MANEEIASPLASLMKEKYGITRYKGSLTMTAKDDFSTILRKTAKYIYSNQDWDDEAKYQSLDAMAQATMAYYSSGIAFIKTFASGDQQPKLVDAKTTGEGQYVLNYNNGNEITFALDPNNKDWAHQGNLYSLRNKVNAYQITGNINYTLGYGKIMRGLLDTYHQQDTANQRVGLTEQDFLANVQSLMHHSNYLKILGANFLEYSKETKALEILNTANVPQMNFTWTDSGDQDVAYLINKTGNYSIDRRAVPAKDFVQTDRSIKPTGKFPKEFTASDQDLQVITRSNLLKVAQNNQIGHLIGSYLDDTFGLVQQVNYDQQLNKSTHARAWEEKKNINKSTQNAMETTVLNKQFKHVEIDNEVSIELFKQFEHEMNRLSRALPKGKQEPTLRLRKLGNHKALGMYVPLLNTVVLDFRTMDQVGEQRNKINRDLTGEPGISSFIHEYGHYLDHQLATNKDVDSRTLATSAAFSKIRNGYRQNVAGTLASNKANYYTMPTEIFARGLEVWVAQNKIKSNLAAKPENVLPATTASPEYRGFRGLEDEITKFYDQLPGLAKFKEQYQEHDFSEPTEPTVTKTEDTPKGETPTKKVRAKTAVSEITMAGQTSLELPTEPNREGIDSLGLDGLTVNQDQTNRAKLDQYAKELLAEHTNDIGKFERLVDATSSSLDDVNPNRLISVVLNPNEYNQSMTLISDQALRQVGFPIDRYPNVNKANGYVAQKNGKFTVGTVYNYGGLVNAVFNQKQIPADAQKQLNVLDRAYNLDHTKIYTTQNPQVRDQVNQWVKGVDQANQVASSPNLDKKIAYSIMAKAVVANNQPVEAYQVAQTDRFHFNDAEKQIFAKLKPKDREKLYLTATKHAKQLTNSVQRQLKRTQAIDQQVQKQPAPADPVRQLMGFGYRQR